MRKIFVAVFVLLLPSFSFAIPTGDIATIATNARFQSRVNYYINQSSLNVLSEDPQTVNHALRVIFAKSIVTGPVTLIGLSPIPNQNNLLQRYSLEVLTNTTIAAEAQLVDNQQVPLPDFNIPDADLQFTINSLFNDFAGISN